MLVLCFTSEYIHVLKIYVSLVSIKWGNGVDGEEKRRRARTGS